MERRLVELGLQNSIVPTISYTTVFIESLKRIDKIAADSSKQEKFAKLLKREDPLLTEEKINQMKLLFPVSDLMLWVDYLIVEFNKGLASELLGSFSGGLIIIGRAASR